MSRRARLIWMTSHTLRSYVELLCYASANTWQFMYTFCISDVHAYFISGNIHLPSTYWSEGNFWGPLASRTKHKLPGLWKRSNYGELRHCCHCLCFFNGLYQFLLQNSCFSLWMPSGSITEFTVKWRSYVRDWAQTSQSGFLLQNGWILDSSVLKGLWPQWYLLGLCVCRSRSLVFHMLNGHSL